MPTGPDDLPIRLHGDEGPGQKNKNVLVVNMSFPYTHSGDSCLQFSYTMSRLWTC